MIPLEEARGLAAAQAALSPVQVPVEQGLGCVLAEPVRALLPIPHADTSAMDGWAVTADPPGQGWEVSPIAATGPADILEPLQSGQAAGVVTGSPIPEGASSVLRSEHSRRDEQGRLHAEPGTPDLSPGRNIRPRAAEADQGEELLAVGDLLTPLRAATAAVAGVDTLLVRPRPRVQIIATGTEVISSGIPAPGEVRDSFSMTLPALLTAMGAQPQGQILRNPDDAEALAASLAPGPDSPDLVVTVGGTAHSPADPLRRALAAQSAQILIPAVDMRPGHPVVLAQLPESAPGQATYVLGLPGNPLAGYAALTAIGLPLINALRGFPESAAAQPRRMRAGQDLEPARKGTRLLPVRYTPNGVVPAGFDRPHMMRGLAHAQAFAIVPTGDRGEGIPAGAPVDCLPIPTQQEVGIQPWDD